MIFNAGDVVNSENIFVFKLYITTIFHPMKKPLSEKKITRKKMCSKKKENLYIVQESENPNCTAKE